MIWIIIRDFDRPAVDIPKPKNQKTDRSPGFPKERIYLAIPDRCTLAARNLKEVSLYG